MYAACYAHWGPNLEMNSNPFVLYVQMQTIHKEKYFRDVLNCKVQFFPPKNSLQHSIFPI